MHMRSRAHPAWLDTLAASRLSSDPHRYYGHLRGDIPEFLRFRQLLLWCLEDEIGRLKRDKGFQRENDSIQAAVMGLLDDLYQGITTQHLSTNWAERVTEPVNIMPNARNLEMQTKHEAYGRTVQK
jgi:hypothetical protein